MFTPTPYLYLKSVLTFHFQHFVLSTIFLETIYARYYNIGYSVYMLKPFTIKTGR